LLSVKYFSLAFSVALIGAAGLLSGCATVDSSKPDLKVSAFWVQDTLAEKNYQFRKVNRMTPVVYKKTIVVGNALDGIVSYDLETKNEKWRIAIPRGVEASGAAIRDTLFVGGLDGKLYSVNLPDGRINWTFDTKTEVVSEPLLDEGVLYFMAGSQSMYAVDGVSGKQMWSYSRQDTSSNMTVRGGSKPALVGGMLYVGFSDGSLVALNAQTGTEQWEITLNRNTKFKDIDSSPVVSDDVLLINSYDDKLYCISKNKGEIIWSVPYGGSSTPLVIEDKVYTTSSRGELLALSKKDGSLLWKRDTKMGIYTDPINFNNLLVSGESQGKLMFFEKDSGKVLGSFEPGRGVFSKPAVHEGHLYFISGEANVYGVSAEFPTRHEIPYLR
jgi:outer membrane protein assembly factor BamB